MFSEAQATFILTSVPHLKPSQLKKWLKFTNSAQKFLNFTSRDLEDLLGKEGAEKISLWVQQKKWLQELEEIESRGVQLLSFYDEGYPLSLRKLSDPPLLLFIIGQLRDMSTLSVVGTRRATSYGKEMAETISREVAEKNIAIVSGFAEGIDRAAHSGALQTGYTYAVLGSGFNHIYPSVNRDLLQSIKERGALISEFSLNTTPQPYNFPRRNRIVSALGDALFVVESPLKGGSMITVEESLKLNKKIFTLPGRVDYESFAGNHHLIKEQKAKLVENTSDILKEMRGGLKSKQSEMQRMLPLQESSNLLVSLTMEEKALFDRLPDEEKNIDELVLLTQFPIMQLNVLLTRLLLKKVIKEYPGKIFKKNILCSGVITHEQ